MNDEEKLKVNMAAAKLLNLECHVGESEIDAVTNRHGFTEAAQSVIIGGIAAHGDYDWREFDIFNNLADCLAVVKKLGERQVSIRASDGGNSWAYYDEHEHSWSVGYHTYEEAVAATVLEVISD